MNLLTPVGAFSASPGPYGTFDMGGDVSQWNEAVVSAFGHNYRVANGGSWGDNFFRHVLVRSVNSCSPTYELRIIGFRVASVPEPGSIMLVVSAAVVVLIWWRRRS